MSQIISAPYIDMSTSSVEGAHPRAHLAQLHEHIDNAQEIAGGQRARGIAARHVVLVKRALALAEPAAHHVLVLARQLLLHVAFQAPQQEGPQDAV